MNELSFPSWERGLKLKLHTLSTSQALVVPLVGTWIEIFPNTLLSASFASFPSWERGLKSLWRIGPGMISTSFPSWERGLKSLQTPMTDCIFLVVPLVGTWIEISSSHPIES